MNKIYDLRTNAIIYDCGCKVILDAMASELIYCPTHKAAPELLLSLKDMVEEYQNCVPYNRRDSFRLEQAADIIVKADGKE